ncbi:DUF2846 domain-containing protein [Aquipseudomonas ullengensis]|uniref:DUF2846 domain-containing protein n=1 Tax=Aquipseudomonas ullengensis TaxID=2759166 RepID=A0A7W4LQ33_9GAMM|nr:DUF2846 domain-containing protein [Pseudomonas ullengensis]MBB2497232.1 DUF2846 domain-containing protein [Pseudomonas ullengensis]
MRHLPVLSLILLILTGCAGPGYFEALPPSSPDQAVVYLYRPKADNPGTQPLRFSYPDVLIDEQSVGTLQFNAYRRVELAPGLHTLRITGLTRQAKWEPRDIKQNFTVAPGEIKYLKLDVRFNLSEMPLGSFGPSYLIHIRPMRPDDAVYEIRTTEPQTP